MDLDLDKKTIQTLYNLIDCGVNPDALAAMIKEMKQLSQFVAQISCYYCTITASVS